MSPSRRRLTGVSLASPPPSRQMKAEANTYVGVRRVTGAAFSSGLGTYVGNSGGSGREGTERRLKLLCSKAVEGSAPGSVPHQGLTRRRFLAACCQASRRRMLPSAQTGGAAPSGLASGSPDTRGEPAEAATRPRTPLSQLPFSS